MNERYEAKFGHSFIICASGKAAEDMLAAVQQRQVAHGLCIAPSSALRLGPARFDSLLLAQRAICQAMAEALICERPHSL